LLPIRDEQFQPPTWMILDTGYPTVSPLIDHAASDLPTPDRSRWIGGNFAPLAGASKMDFAPTFGPFKQYRGSLVVALWGDRAPFSTSGMPLKSPAPGYKLMICDPDSREVKNFIYNTMGGPASRLENGRDTGLERPIDAKFNPADGTLYILDFGFARMKGSREVVKSGTGRIFRLLPLAPEMPTTQK